MLVAASFYTWKRVCITNDMACPFSLPVGCPVKTKDCDDTPEQKLTGATKQRKRFANFAVLKTSTAMPQSEHAICTVLSEKMGTI